jgi:hypothetical protein
MAGRRRLLVHRLRFAPTAACAFLIATVMLSGCGREGGEQARTGSEEAAPANPASVAAGRFFDLRPRAGDILVPPRIGLRWRYDPSGSAGPGGGGAASDSLADRPFEISGLVFRVHVVDSLDVPYVETRTWDTDIRVTLPPRTPPGTYFWWVESLAEDDTTILAASERQSFRIG